jgi:XTP/dITP diphosphohydrolase
VFLKILIATGNKGKIRELSSMLKGMSYEIVGLQEFPDPPSVIEDGVTYEENALKKARTMFKFSGLLTIADDSGLEVDALNNAPGVYSARFASLRASDEENNMKLLSLVKDVPDKNRGARFIAVVACVGQGIEKVFRGEIQGRIVHESAGTHGFGYDPLFIPEGFDRTFAQLGDSVKNKISHRARALRKLADFLRSQTA